MKSKLGGLQLSSSARAIGQALRIATCDICQEGYAGTYWLVCKITQKGKTDFGTKHWYNRLLVWIIILI